ncbi:hypothetical protein BS623_20145 [Vibrio parahaemolyticus]|uniref:hypothetical protein n=1 Tax=Vibrio parahaemolyticus TaxID=670 RepID=UPI000A3D4B02|nr:hypothetical protein [Vibrio parahaemolyticus]OUD38837.1 hypothetical protein BS623_20145 [Vibrio parahaemolyticus]
MMDTNENDSKRVFILVHPAVGAGGYIRQANSLIRWQGTLDYVLKGDALLYTIEGSSMYSVIRWSRLGAELGNSKAESYLYSGLELQKPEILDMYFHEGAEATRALISSLTDYVVECHVEEEVSL